MFMMMSRRVPAANGTLAVFGEAKQTQDTHRQVPSNKAYLRALDAHAHKMHTTNYTDKLIQAN